MKIGNFTLLEEIDGGTTSTVWKAYDNVLRRNVAIKIASSNLLEIGSLKSRFLREARAAASLKHPSVVDIIGSSDYEGQAFIIFELIEGAQTLQSNDIDFATNAKNFAGMCDALELAHSKRFTKENGETFQLSLVHGDIKPANILVDGDGRFKLADFGAATFRGSGQTDDNQISGGTCAYWSPRRFNFKPSSSPCDQWAMGVTMWEFFTGTHPFLEDGMNRGKLAQQVIGQPPLGDVSRLPEDLKAIISKMIEKQPSARYADFSAVSADLHNFANGRIVTARRPSVLELSQRWAKKNRVFLSLFCLSLISMTMLQFAWQQSISLGNHARQSAQSVIDLLTVDMREKGLKKRRELLDNVKEIESHIDSSLQPSPQLYKAIAQQRIKLNNFSSAITALAKGLALNPISPIERDSLLLLLGRAYIDNKQPKEGIGILQPFIDVRSATDLDLEFLVLYNYYAMAKVAIAQSTYDAVEHAKDEFPDFSEATEIFRVIHRQYVKSNEKDNRMFMKNELNLLATRIAWHKSYKYGELCQRWLQKALSEYGESWKQVPLMYTLLYQIDSFNGDFDSATLHAEEALGLTIKYQSSYQPLRFECQLNLISALKNSGRVNEAKFQTEKLTNLIADLKNRECFAELNLSSFDFERQIDLNADSGSFANPEGYTDTPTLPMQGWPIHSPLRPMPKRALAIDNSFTPPPTDAIILFDGTAENNGFNNNSWLADEGGVMTSSNGDTRTTQSFGDCHLHVEFRTPTNNSFLGQKKGNSGVFLMDKYEIQILDSYDNHSYADGTCGAVYGQFPPTVNVTKPGGEWQSYDIYFTRPRFNDKGDHSQQPRFTVFHNGVAIHVARSIEGPTAWRSRPTVVEHADRLPIRLQDHNGDVSFRNIWIRDLEQN
ncbi:MAG TPA: DUF1080 domain-containing protein [Planctomycetes bacterium]|nr:DUF1080 domain-containing protein [Planctomycetota bacterium]